jgi:hypothetical protein
MAETYFVVLDEQAYPNDANVPTTGGPNKSGKASSEVVEGLKSARVVKLLSNVGTVADAQAMARELYPSFCSTTPVVVTSAQWKTS